MIEIINYERVNDGKKIGYVDIYLPKRKEYISRIAHFQSGDRRWFNLPCYQKKFSDGTVKYYPIWRMDPDTHNNDLLEALSDPVKIYCLEHKIAEIEPLNLSASFDGDMPF